MPILLIVLVAIVIAFLLNFGGIRKAIITPITQKGGTTTSQPVIQKESSYAQPSSSDIKGSPSTGQEEAEENISDKTPPIRFNPQPTGYLPSNTLKTTISLQTDEIATCRYSIYSGVSYDAMYNFFQHTNSTSHSTEITTLEPDQKFTFYVKCADKFGNKNPDDFPITFDVSAVADITPPQLRYLSPYGVLLRDTKETILTVTTDEKAYCQYSNYPTGATTTDSNLISGGFWSNNTQTYHTAYISGLENGGTYDFFVKCTDTSGNTSPDTLIRFQVAS